MTKYEVFKYDRWCNDVLPTGIIIYTDTSKSSICKKLGLNDPYKINAVNYNEEVIYVDYDGTPYCELREID